MIGNGIDHDHAYPRTLSTLLAANRDELKARERKLDNPHHWPVLLSQFGPSLP
jgi:hypothetical protein